MEATEANTEAKPKPEATASTEAKPQHDASTAPLPSLPDVQDLSQAARKQMGATSGHGVPSLECPVAPITAVCRMCQKEVDPIQKGVRLCKKSHPQEWQCASCNNKCVTLYNAFGTWPIQAYTELSDIEKTGFWVESGTGKKALLAAVEKKIIYNQVKRLIDDNVGQFLPLQVWVNQGWDAEDILKCPSEIHKVTGKRVYQVAIHTTGTQTAQELARKEMGRLLKNSKGSSEPVSGDDTTAKGPSGRARGDDKGPTDPLRLFPGGSGQSSDAVAKSRSRSRKSDSRKKRHSKQNHRRRRSPTRSSKSRSDRRSKSKRRSNTRRRSKSQSKPRRGRSRSRRGKRSRSRKSLSPRSKKLEAEIKAKVEKEQEKRDALAEKARLRALSSDATKTIQKIGHLTNDLAKLKKDKSYHLIPGTMQLRLQSALETLELYKSEAHKRLHGCNDALDFTLKDVSEAFKSGAGGETGAPIGAPIGPLEGPYGAPRGPPLGPP